MNTQAQEGIVGFAEVLSLCSQFGYQGHWELLVFFSQQGSHTKVSQDGVSLHAPMPIILLKPLKMPQESTYLLAPVNEAAMGQPTQSPITRYKP